MAAVDPDDDDIERHVVRHYVFDPVRRERRHRVVAAFDNRDEWMDLLNHLADELRRRRDAGAQVDPQEHYTGTVLPPGHRRRQRDGRLLGNTVRRGITPTPELLAGLDLPQNIGYFTTDDAGGS